MDLNEIWWEDGEFNQRPERNPEYFSVEIFLKLGLIFHRIMDGS